MSVKAILKRAEIRKGINAVVVCMQSHKFHKYQVTHDVPAEFHTYISKVKRAMIVLNIASA